MTSDVARLRRLIMCPPGPEALALSSYDEYVMPMAGLDAPTMLAEHAELTRDIRSSGTEILTIPELRGSAIEAARSRGT